ncbi:zinc-dependent metalloprotease [Mucilaginibacter daejeonensis]|uniref:zinc-dependent metalloprotease n=1 Tax=Mucilaginibacter daejeonensis TaxID=398049 RepID=UPI001D17B71C|nr:zinc-dependent metalloprotease [Mucilaginibacter daejeonensis]UEG52161.1 zinc-dependent metalloprotease [Mucilaginibacter daejeonensis]
MNFVLNMRYVMMCGLVLCGLASSAQKAPETPAKADSVKKPVAVQPYSKVIPASARKQKGVFTVVNTESKWFFEIPDSLMGRYFLVVTRYTGTPSGNVSMGGEETNEQTVYFEKAPGNKVFMRGVVYRNDSADSTQAIYRSLKVSNVNPIAAAFDIKAVNAAGKSTVIDVTDLFKKDNPVMSISSKDKGIAKVGSIADDRSFIEKISAYPLNIEARTTKTYTSTSGSLYAAQVAGAITYSFNVSMVLLPKVPMKKRFFDERVGYFANRYTLFNENSQRTRTQDYIQRFRLEPKPEYMDKYNKGILVEPAKPIVFYLDPATPKKWRPYLIAGVNDWQKAFEKAGFKNAIMAKEWPENDTTMSLEDARYSVIRYMASETPNAYGPRISDPRSGEIMESHVVWYHNVMKLVHNWYMIQAGAIDPRARKMEFDDQLMGELIRFVSSHEVGHTIGLRHNMGASSQTPVEKLREKKWVEANGHTVSIMDYARFNYVAQPEDHISKEGIYPRIGAYDKWAIQWGYRLLPGDQSEEQESKVLNKMIVDSLARNPRLWFGGEGKNEDPRSQAEDLSDNVTRANEYGMKNLKRVVAALPLWTREEGDQYDNLKELHKAAIGQYSRYLDHVVKNIVGRYITVKSVEQNGAVYTPIPKQRTKEAIHFIGRNLFEAPMWLYPESITNKLGTKVADDILDQQNRFMNTLIAPTYLYNLHNMELTIRKDYPVAEYLNDIKREVWKPLGKNELTNSFRRSLERSYVEKLDFIINPKQVKEGWVRSNAQRDDTRLVVIQHTRNLLAEVKTMAAKDPWNAVHYQDIVHQINKILHEQSKL